ncbi:MAG: DNA translocase FtsK 4TM domain-containing protein [Pseudomonadales bacterium]|jgi:S-DNA-T family DNA segregation ATPase FtsK/SpoIIIE|nr:DNA translocase FtsK 4TM domain-containing protein [Gammaproteobacteria bacterium]MBP6050594.1 DNA translocase FtsK 4TM domain-containing protein [Pseudomonadales bacterium]MBK6583441.1 DNA translocase FtsK 4TM domain-containing protein [Gammaproteobacteria bacterium]MBK7168941.1 DNA translocase FtsK 4TM domain-containing protein [Gammaproteobacteria bacterium]MBK7521095.1 DNA translocase FtsK 4TM domain-containing protein [Gammaproteobacteria bacterium]
MHGIREGLIIGLLAFGAYLLLALGTYSVGDPGWSSTGNGAAISNSGGAAGAWIADVLLSLFGYVSYLLPLMLGYRAWAQVRVRQTPLELDWLLVSIRGVGCVLVVISGTGLLALKGSVTTLLPFGIGGMLGETLAQVCPRAFGFAGSQLLLMSLMLFGMTIFTDLSWLRLTEQTGRLALLAWERIRPVGALLWQRLRPVHDGEDGAQEQERAESAPRKRRQRREPQMEDADDTMSMVDAREPVLRLPEIRLPEKRRESGERLLREKQGKLFAPSGATELPPLGLLEMADKSEQRGFSAEALESMSRLLEIKLRDFGVDAKVVAVDPGPVITRFEIQPAAGVKVNRISNLVKDLARSLAVISVRVVEVIPGKSVVGIEIPNEDREMVMFGDVLSSRAYEASKSPLTLALGNDISGEPVVVDLARMPHLLVAGTTGSGKSVGVNAMLLSLLYKSTPAEVRLIMVDPKMLELSVYEGIPHLLTPVITDMKDAANGLRWCVGEMERRYKLMAAMGVRNLAGFNRKVIDAAAAGEPIADPFWQPDPMVFISEEEQLASPPMLEALPAIVVVIDEFADMMMIVGKKVEELIARIAQKARAAGIHLILATQRPSVDVITGLIKANIPTRIAFQVSSKIDSRTILDQGGAEQLLGHGDMLYLPPGSGVPIRVHGAFVSDAEVHRVVANLREGSGPNYIEGILEESSAAGMTLLPGESSDNPEEDGLYDEAVRFVTESRKASISAVQRKLRIGYNRAARMIEAMEAAGVVTSMNSNGSREVLAPPPPSH